MIALAGFLAIAALQVLHSFRLGRDLSTIGAEFRVLLGFATCFIALPIVSEARERERLIRALPLIGLALGLWGIAQWVLQLEFAGAGDAGVREGIRFTTAGVGQIQGGLFAFPVAVLLALAALMSGQIRSAAMRALLIGVVLLNGISMLLGYERTFWVATLIAFIFLIAKMGGTQRTRGVFWGLCMFALTLVALSTFASRELTAARERLLSLGEYGTDSSVQYRLTESRHALEEIQARPVSGSGYGATIFWGRPWVQVPPESFRYIHNGYLWLAWRIGLPGALLLCAPLAAVVVWRRRAEDGPLFGSVRCGCQAALLAILIASLTFPSFNSLHITSTMGLLLAICASPLLPRAALRARARGSATSAARRPNATSRTPEGAAAASGAKQSAVD